MINKRSTKTKGKSDNDDFEITKRVGKDLEKKLNGIEKHPKLLAKQIIGSLPKLKCKSKKQREYYDLISASEISFVIGSPGCGKSFLQVYNALELLLDTENNYNQILITTSPVESEDKMGFLPGNADEKMLPYIWSTYSIIEQIIGKKALDELIEKRIIIIAPLSFLRGCTHNNLILIFEEAQNSTIKSLKTLLSRIGENTKYMIGGDINQSDRYKKGQLHFSALYYGWHKMKKIESIGFFEFTKEDIIRNSLIAPMMDIFEEDGY